MTRAPDVAVVGAGAFGLTSALRLARAGLSVRVLDRGAGGPPNASAVAAGMLAPVGETLAEDADAEHLRRLFIARDLWPAFATSIPGVEIVRRGVEMLTEGSDARDALLAKLSSLGVEATPLAEPTCGVRVAKDWRLDAPATLTALREALRKLGVDIETASVSADAGGLAVDGQPLLAEWVVIAAGFNGHTLAPAAPELAILSPIKGQIAAYASGLGGRAIRRGAGMYLVPQPSGARAGATMEPGLSDVAVDPSAIARLHAAAVSFSPDLAGLAHRGEAGVRAATPDGWPLVGPSVTPGILLATGARRNGWLLAPLVSQMILDAVTGAEPHPLAQAFHPGRFTR